MFFSETDSHKKQPNVQQLFCIVHKVLIYINYPLKPLVSLFKLSDDNLTMTFGVGLSMGGGHRGQF